MRRAWPTRLAALACLLLLQGCATGLAMIPLEGIEYGHQEVASVFIGAALDIGVSLAVGASMGPPGALIGALAGVAFAALDVWTVIRLGQL